MKLAKVVGAILLVLALTMAILAGCSESNEAGEISDYDSQAFIPIEGNSQTGNESKPNAASGESAGSTTGGNGAGTVTETQTQSGGFLISEKKYDFGGNNPMTVKYDAVKHIENKCSLEGNGLVVLNVENQTGKNCTITINGAYLDENGEVLKEETVTFEGFAAGWKNNFFFVPEIPFAEFTYTLQAEESDGECLAQLFTPYWKMEQGFMEDPSTSKWQEANKALAEWDRGGQVGDFPQVDLMSPCLCLRYGFGFEEIPRDLMVHVRMLILSSDGQPAAYLDYSKNGVSKWNRDDSGDEDTKLRKLKPFYTFPDEENLEWPAEFKGNLTVLFSITDVTDPEPIPVPPVG